MAGARLHRSLDAEGDLMEVNGWTSRRYGASARSARARRSYDRVMDDAPLPESARGRRSSIPTRRDIRLIETLGRCCGPGRDGSELGS